MADLDLTARPRQVLGKRVKRLRRAGILPVNVYGHNVPSLALELPIADMLRVARAAGRTAIIHLQVEGEAEPRNVLLRDLQRDPVGGGPLHADLQQVSLTEKMRAEVPVVLTGKSPAVDTLGGVLVQTANSITIEALPTDMPRHVEVDVSVLADLDTSIHVRDLRLSDLLHVLTDPETVLASVSAPRLAVELEEAAPAAEEEAAAEEAPAAEKEEGAEAEAKAEAE